MSSELESWSECDAWSAAFRAIAATTTEDFPESSGPAPAGLLGGHRKDHGVPGHGGQFKVAFGSGLRDQHQRHTHVGGQDGPGCFPGLDVQLARHCGLVQHFLHQGLGIGNDGGAAFRTDVAEHHQVEFRLVQPELDVVVPHPPDILQRLSGRGEIPFARDIFFKSRGDNGVKQAFLVTEVVVQRGRRNPCQLRDLAGGHRGSRGVCQQFRRRTQQPHFGGKLAIQTHNRYPITYSIAI